jgi:hypothetical protein
MRITWMSKALWPLSVATFVGVVGGIALMHPRSAFSQSVKVNGDQSTSAKRTQTAQPDPWTSDQAVDAATLVKEISGPASGRPVVVSVSPHALYLGGHIPGAVFQGPGFDAHAIEGLKRWAQHLPRSTNLVVYCGCCPLVHCPNLRPAFRALQSMGFTHLRALILPTNFYTDWYAKGYPTEKGS